MSDIKDMIKLSQNQYAADVRAFLDAKALKKKLDADSRKQDGIIKTVRAVLFQAMRGAPFARCGNALLSIKPGRVNPGTLTLKDGRIVPLDCIMDISFKLNGVDDVIRSSDVKSWYGGAVVGDDLEITMTGEST
jgi:hypothetical protein